MNLFELMATISLDTSEYDSGIRESESKGKKLAQSIGSSLKTAGKVIASGIALGASAVAGLTISATKAYADYEQLSGGVQKLFGEEAADQMMKYANEAYRTAGMSANQFMEQSTSFAASLIQSYKGDTIKAANQANKAMMAISDNFNTFGGDISAVQSAYQGFAKQNYTMLDNLKLGYGGTKTEMERLIKDANEYAKANGMAADLTIENFGDIVEAIDLIQQKQGIAGTTAKEAATTISGSIGMMKSAWQNLLVAFADKDADLSQYFGAVADSASTAFKNILPVAKQSLQGIGKVISNVGPLITSELPALVADVLPGFVDVGIQLIEGLTSGIINSLPELTDSAIQISSSLISAIVDNLPMFVNAAFEIINGLRSGIGQAAPTLIPAIVSGILGMISAIVSNIPEFIASGMEMVSGIISGILAAIPLLVEQAPVIITDLVNAIVTALPMIISTGLELILALINGIIAALPDLIAMAPEIIMTLVDAVIENAPLLLNAGIELIVALVKGVATVGPALWDAGKRLVMGLLDRLSNVTANFGVIGRNIINSIKNAVSATFGSLSSVVSTKFNSIKTKISDAFSGAYNKVKEVVDKLKNIFNFSWSLPKLKLPHFSITGSFSLNPPSVPSFGINWYKKAYETPYMFGKPTVVSAFGFGDGNGAEMVYGRDSLMRDIREAVSKEMPKVIKLYLDGDKLVGGTSERMDGSLGQMQSYQLRWEGA